MGKKGIPDRWEEYSNMGRQIPGTRIICFKVPLNNGLLARLPPSTDRFGPRELMDHCSTLGLVVDLTNTDRYYDPRDFLRNGVEYVKLATMGHVIPERRIMKRFFQIVETFQENNWNNDKLIGVHCTHGINRTGYLVCRYMIQQLELPPDQAIAAFNSARGHEQERENYLDDLRKAAWRSMEYKSPKPSSALLPSLDQLGFQRPEYGHYGNFSNSRNSSSMTWRRSSAETPPYLPQRSRNGKGRIGFGEDSAAQHDTRNFVTGGRPHHSSGSAYAQSPATDESGFHTSQSGSSFQRKRLADSFHAGSSYGGYRSANSSVDESPFGRESYGNSSYSDESPFKWKRLADSSIGESPFGRKRLANSAGNESPFGRKRLANSAVDESPLGRKRLANSAVDESPLGRKRLANSAVDESTFGRKRLANTSVEESSFGKKRLVDSSVNEKSFGRKRSADSSWEDSEPKLKSPKFGKEYYERYFGTQVLPQYDADFYSRGGGGIGPHRPAPKGIPPVKGDGNRPRQYRGPKPYCSPENLEQSTPGYSKNSRYTPHKVSSLLSPDENSTPTGTPNLAYVEGPSRNAFSPGARKEVFSPDNEDGKRKRSNRFQPY